MRDIERLITYVVFLKSIHTLAYIFLASLC